MAGITTTTRPAGRSATAGLQVDGPAAPGGDLHGRSRAAATGSEDHRRPPGPPGAARATSARCAPPAAGSRRRGWAGRAACPPGRGASRTGPGPRASGSRAVTSSPRSRTRRSSATAGRWTRCRGRSRWNHRSPKARAWRLAVFGTATNSMPPRTQVTRGVLQGRRRARADAPANARRPRPTTSPGTDSTSPSRRSLRDDPRSRPSASRPRARKASTSVPSPAPTSSTGPGGASASTRPASCARESSQEGVAAAQRTARCRAGSARRRGRARAGPGQGSVVAAPQAGQAVLPAKASGRGAERSAAPRAGLGMSKRRPAGVRKSPQREATL